MTTMERTRTRLLLDQPFFGSLAMELEMVEDTTVPIASTDGVQLRWNPGVWEGLSTEDRKFVLAHEVMHCALLHPWRTAALDQKLANVAADYVVNDLLKSAGFTLMKGVLYDKRFEGMSMEQVYSKLKSEQPPPEDGGSQSGGEEESESGDSGDDEDGDGQSITGQGKKTAPGQPKRAESGSPTGDFTPAPSDEQGTEAETQWKLAAEGVVQVCKSAGSLPGNAADAIKAAREPRVDWVTETREFIVQASPNEQTWARPDRRFIGEGLYLPGKKRDAVGGLIVAVDCSGSCWSILPKFTAGLQGLLSEAQPESVQVIYWDTKIQGMAEFDSDDTDIELQAKGGGGTMFGPVLDKIEEELLEPVAMIVLTDMYIGDLAHIKEPTYPVLWVTPEYSTGNGPFGRTVRLQEGE